MSNEFDCVSEVLKFDLSPKQMKFKDILNKEFIELEVDAISDANPNINKSHFTLESIQKVVDNGGVKNKPIVGFFEKGDFTTHEGEAEYDPEVDKEYWDTSKGERILGWVRESDPVEIVEKDGLHWLRFRCILCVHYCYRQVKRLLKDRKKKVSVEVIVKRKKQREDGVMDILDFVLMGTTILGSKNGRPIREGIEGASLSVLENLDEAVMSEQRKALTFAYRQIDGSEGSGEEEKSNGKEDTICMENENNEMVVEQSSTDAEQFCENATAVEPETVTTEAAAETTGENCGNLEMSNESTCADEGEATAASEGQPENESCGEGSDATATEGGNDDEAKFAELNAKVEELTTECQNYSAKIEELERASAEMQEAHSAELAKFADYSEIKDRMEKAEKKVFEYFCNDMKNRAVSMMENERINKEDYDSIVAKCSEGKYSTEEEIKRDVAYAVYSARPVGQGRYSAPITAPATKTVAVETQGMTPAERIAARCGQK